MIAARSYQWLWFQAFLVTLAGYALMGKGFAYLFLGDLMVLVGLFLLFRSRRLGVIFNDFTLTCWLFFAVWGALRTFPYLSHYKFDAVRDAVLWGYGIVAVILAAFIRQKEQIYVVLIRYSRFLKWYLPYAVIPMIIFLPFEGSIPRIPWAKMVPIIYIKPGDMGVYLSGAALFLLIFLRGRQGRATKDISLFRILQIAGWSLCFIRVAASNRAGLLSVAVPVAMVSILRPQKVGFRVAVIGVAALALALTLLELNPVPIKVKGQAFNAERITSVLGSIGSDSETAHKGTEKWRLVWWTKIVHYTIFGQYRWLGKGFGVNLATVDGPPGIGKDEVGLRSPHNATMTVLARMGIPGLLLWVALQFSFAFRMIHAYMRSVRIGAAFWADVYLWIFGFWMAALINSSLDVYIEGPQGGILFWSIMGVGIASLRVGKVELRKLAVLNYSAFSPNEKVLSA